MKKWYTIIALAILSCCHPKIQHQNPEKTTGKIPDFYLERYKVVRIDSIGTVYLIYAQKDNLVYKIVSAKVESGDCKNIKVNGEYGFHLFTRFFSSRKTAPNITGVEVNGTTVHVEDGCVDDLFNSINVKGLCIQ